MPLHAITSVHGEPELRERLAIEIAACPAAGRAGAADALALASRLHAADRRQREPYVNHLLRVAIRILHHYRVRDTDVTCAALLHDAVEDHAAGIAPGGRDDALGVLAARFGANAAGLVAAVTNPEYEPGRDEHQQYREHVTASLDAGPWARVIKASDFTDNAVGVIHVTGPKLSRLATEVRPVGAGVAGADPAPGHPAGRRRQDHDRRAARHRPWPVRRDLARNGRRRRAAATVSCAGGTCGRTRRHAADRGAAPGPDRAPRRP
jgi:HD domain